MTREEFLYVMVNGEVVKSWGESNVNWVEKKTPAKPFSLLFDNGTQQSIGTGSECGMTLNGEILKVKANQTDFFYDLKRVHTIIIPKS